MRVFKTLRTTFSYSNLHDMTDSIIEILDVECSRQHCTCMYDSMYRCGKNSCHATFSPATFLPDVLRFFIWRTLTNNHSIAPWIIRHLFHTVSEIACSNHRAHIDAKLGHYFKCMRYEEMRKRLVHLDNDTQKWEGDLFTLTVIRRNEKETCSHWQWYAEMRKRLVHLDSDMQKWERDLFTVTMIRRNERDLFTLTMIRRNEKKTCSPWPLCCFAYGKGSILQPSGPAECC